MTETEPTGKLDVLNVGAGHMEFRFNKDDSIERERAKRCVQDMLRMGYALFIQLEDGTQMPVKKFNQKSGHYIIADVPATAGIGEPLLGKRGRPKLKAVPMEKAKATAVGRTAGG